MDKLNFMMRIQPRLWAAAVIITLLVAACTMSSTPTSTYDASWSPTALPPTQVTPSATLTKTPRPTRTPTLTPAQSATPTHAWTPTPVQPGVASPTPTIRGIVDAPPPFDITLPDDWKAHFYEFGILRPDGQEMPVKFAFYNGPTPTHAAVITVLWDYPDIWQEAWRDGIEMVSVVFDPSCQFNLIDLEAQPFTIGIHYADGVRYTVSNCETEPDVYGWLVGYRRNETNYLFYIRITPVEGARDEAAFVQNILDTIRFSGEK